MMSKKYLMEIARQADRIHVEAEIGEASKIVATSKPLTPVRVRAARGGQRASQKQQSGPCQPRHGFERIGHGLCLMLLQSQVVLWGDLSSWSFGVMLRRQWHG
jgi:hypothetical protein